ncbi:Obg-like ATPase 1 [Castilleja foliolosa]|uniref:Obg-like ATPase 1 n=1 Tax=Castilleja foliolosa TaxID=1961234 RepID=A0ABD3C6B5_9LAMI
MATQTHLLNVNCVLNEIRMEETVEEMIVRLSDSGKGLIIKDCIEEISQVMKLQYSTVHHSVIGEFGYSEIKQLQIQALRELGHLVLQVPCGKETPDGTALIILEECSSKSRNEMKKSGKSKEDSTEMPILGRFSSNLEIGIIGLPKVGKSTLFQTLTKLSGSAENVPVCTIEPNEASVKIPDDRFDYLCQLFKPKSEVSAFLKVQDIAGLVRGTDEGKGLGKGSKMFSHIRAVDGFFHVLRAFEDPSIIHIDGTVDPVRDLEIISADMRLKDIDFIERRVEYLRESMEGSNDKELKIENNLCKRVKEALTEGKDIRLLDWKADEIDILNTFKLLTAKPVVYLVNTNEKDYQRKENRFLPKIHAWVQEHGGDSAVIPFSCALEINIADLSQDEAEKYCVENNVESCLPKIIKTGFASINLVYFFTAGPDEVKCWKIPRQTKALQAAGAVHTKFEKGFISAEVMKFEDLKKLGSKSAVKASGKYRQEGKNYIVQDGDIIFFKFNAPSDDKADFKF